MLKNTTYIFDFDSTFTQVEALDILGSIVLTGVNKEKQLEKIADITNQGMSGKLSFNESLKERMKILSGNRSDIIELVKILKTKISISILKNKDFFTTNSQHILIVSSGFKEFIEPVVSEFGIPANHVYANTFAWNDDGKITGFDSTNLLSKDGGKPALVEQLNLSGRIIVIGDGYTDYEIKKAGKADVFVAYTENVSRPIVTEKADFVATNFNNFLNFINYGKTIIP